MLASRAGRASSRLLFALVILLGGAALVWIAATRFPRDSGPAAGPDPIAPSPEELRPAVLEAEPPARATSGARASVELEPGSPEEIAAGPGVGERDLVALVVGPGGEPCDGVPVGLYLLSPDGRSVAPPRESRTTGVGGPDDDEAASGLERNPARAGLAFWSASRGLLRETWSAFDRGGDAPRLAVGVTLPGNDAHRVELDLAIWPTEPVELELSEADLALVEPLRAEVFFADGRPAPGIPVALLGMPVDPALGNLGDFGTALSDGDGIARIPRDEQLGILGLFAQMAGDRGNAQAGAASSFRDFFEFFVTADLPVTLPPRVPVASAPLPGETVRLELPALGRVVAEVVDTGDEPFDASANQLEYRINWTRGPQPPKNRESLETMGGSTEAANIELGWVGLGMRFQGRVWPRDRSSPGDSLEFDGPDVPGEVVTVRFRVGAPYPRLAHRVLGPDGAPLSNATIERVVRNRQLDDNPVREQRRHWKNATTDSNGRFLWTRQGEPSVPQLLELRAEIHGVEYFAARDLPMRLEQSMPRVEWPDGDAHPFDLGDVQLGSEPLPALPQPREELLVAGVVTDEVGAPIRDVTVWARIAGENTNLGHVKTDASGSFELRSRVWSTFSLELYHDDYVAGYERELEPGSTGLGFALERAGRLHGRLIGSSGSFEFAVDLRASVGEVTRSARIDHDGRFEIRGLPAGEATLRVTGGEPGFVLLVLEGLEVSSAESSTDPRLSPLDASALCKRRWFRFERGDGEVPDGHVWMSVEGHPRRSFDLSGRDRRLLVLPRDAKRATLEMSGCAPVEVDLGGGAEFAADVLVRFDPSG